LRDARGSTVGLANSSGNLTAGYSYGAYGTPVGTAPSGPAFTGQIPDPATGLYYDNARYYDPGTGRFLSPDPMAASNPYPYAANDPTNVVDPSGATLPGAAIREEATTEPTVASGDRIGACVVSILAGVAGAVGSGITSSGFQGVEPVSTIAGSVAACLGSAFFTTTTLVQALIAGGLLGAAGGAITGAIAAWESCKDISGANLGRAVLIGATEGAIGGGAAGFFGAFGGPTAGGAFEGVSTYVAVPVQTFIAGAPSAAAGAVTSNLPKNLHPC
jgi:RHS repeat-associated protein